MYILVHTHTYLQDCVLETCDLFFQMLQDRGPKDLIDIRILHSGFKIQFKVDSRNHGV